jgi:alcohol dehydrogenase class IV
LVGLDGFSADALSTKLIDMFKERLIEFEMPISLKDMKISREQYESKRESLIKYAENDSGILSNPRDVDYKDFVKIFECIYEGKEIDF